MRLICDQTKLIRRLAGSWVIAKVKVESIRAFTFLRDCYLLTNLKATLC